MSGLELAARLFVSLGSLVIIFAAFFAGVLEPPGTHRSKVGLAVLIIVGLVALAVAQSAPASAQQLDPLRPVQAYTSADPNNADRIGLITPDGRYSITPMQGCDWLAPDQDVNEYPSWAVAPWLGLSGTDSAQPGCIVRIEGRMSDQPCVTNAAGLCDVTADTD